MFARWLESADVATTFGYRKLVLHVMRIKVNFRELFLLDPSGNIITYLIEILAVTIFLIGEFLVVLVDFVSHLFLVVVWVSLVLLTGIFLLVVGERHVLLLDYCKVLVWRNG